MSEKSGLFWEFARSASTKGWLILKSSSVSHGKATAFLPVAELLRAYFQLEARDDARALCQRVADKLAALDEALIAAVPALLTLLDVPVEAREWERLDSTERRQQTLNALKRLVLQATTWWVGRSGFN